MKKMLCVLAVLCLLPVFALGEAANVEPLSGNDFVFLMDDSVYELGMDAGALISAVEEKYGVPMQKIEVESCMFDGMDKEFSNNDLVLGTYPVNGDMLETVLVLTEAFETARGACVGMTLDQVADLYGDDFTLDYDQMIYQMGENGPMLVFAIDLESDEVICWSIMRNTTK